MVGEGSRADSLFAPMTQNIVHILKCITKKKKLPMESDPKIICIMLRVAAISNTFYIRILVMTTMKIMMTTVA